MTEDYRHAARVRGQSKAGKPIRNGDANLGARGMQVLLGLAHIRALLHELRRKAHWQFLWQLQIRQLKLFVQIVVRKTGSQHSQEIPLLSQLLKQRWQSGGDLRKL